MITLTSTVSVILWVPFQMLRLDETSMIKDIGFVETTAIQISMSKIYQPNCLEFQLLWMDSNLPLPRSYILSMVWQSITELRH